MNIHNRLSKLALYTIVWPCQVYKVNHRMALLRIHVYPVTWYLFERFFKQLPLPVTGNQLNWSSSLASSRLNRLTKLTQQYFAAKVLSFLQQYPRYPPQLENRKLTALKRQIFVVGKINKALPKFGVHWVLKCK